MTASPKLISRVGAAGTVASAGLDSAVEYPECQQSWVPYPLCFERKSGVKGGLEYDINNRSRGIS